MAQPATDGWSWEDNADDASDATLVARTLQGRPDAFEALFDRYARQVYHIAYRISGSPTEAEDLTQDVFLRAFRTLGTLRQPQAVAAWLYQMATNVCLDARRRRTVPQAELSAAVIATHPDEAGWRSPEAMALAGDDQRAVWEALGRLAPSQRAALTLRELYGLSYGEIATTLDASVGAVEVLIFRARRRFRDQYGKVAAGATVKTGEQGVRCAEVRASLAAVLDDAPVAGTARAATLAHVRTCATCQAELAAQRRDNRARALLPLLPLPLAVKGHVLAHLAAALGTAAAGTGAATGATGATMTTSSGGAAATTTGTTIAASSSAPLSAATSAATLGTAGTGTTGTGATTAVGAKIGVLAATKALLIAAGLATVTAAVAVPLLRPHQAWHNAAPTSPRSRPAPPPTGGGSRSGTSSVGPHAVGTRRALLVHMLTPGATMAPAPRLVPPRGGRPVTHTPAIPRLPPHHPVTPARRTRPQTAQPVTVTHAATARPARRVHAVPRVRAVHHAASGHINTKPAKTLHSISYRQVRPPRIVRKAAVHPSPSARHTVTRQYPVVRRTMAVRQHPVVRHRATPLKTARRRVHTPVRHAAAQKPLSVAWPGGVLHFDQRQALHIHTLPGARVDVLLRIERRVSPHSRGPVGPRVVRIVLHARADRHGDASVPLRYAYVPTRPTPVTVTVTMHDGRRTIRRVATMMLVRR